MTTKRRSIGRRSAGSAAYPVGAVNEGSFSELFAFEVPMCGNALAEASWVVELSSPIPDEFGSTPQAQLLLAPLAYGWQVWSQAH